MPEEKKTNGDVIRSMSDEELADCFTECSMCVKHPAICDLECYEGHLEYLKQEVKENDEA